MLTTPPLTVEAATGATAACSDGRRKRHRAGGAAGTGTEVGVVAEPLTEVPARIPVRSLVVMSGFSLPAGVTHFCLEYQ